MPTPSQGLQLPPRLTNEQGNERRVGVELEMNGLHIDHLADLVARKLGLEVQKTSRYERTLTGDPAGEWLVELDFNFLKQLGRETRSHDRLLDELEDTAETLLARGAEHVVPVELVSPPLPISRLGEIDGLIRLLREAGVLGTSGRLLYAFSLQFNPEVPATDANTISDYLKAFICLYDWLDQRAEINFTRRLTSYIDPFPRSYTRKLMWPGYRPELSMLIDDYLIYNPTRNRALDMLPLFCHLDEKRVKAVVTDVLVKARPTFHYRLPNCEIDIPGWGLHLAWNDWVEVERLAEDKPRLDACCSAYSGHLEFPFNLPGGWLRELEEKWLK